MDMWLISHAFTIINKTAMNIRDKILSGVVFWNLISQLFISNMENYLILISCFVFFNNGVKMT